MPKWTIFLISSKVSNSQSKEFVLITEIFWRIFWLDNWRSLIVVVENFHLSGKKIMTSFMDGPLAMKYQKPCQEIQIDHIEDDWKPQQCQLSFCLSMEKKKKKRDKIKIKVESFYDIKYWNVNYYVKCSSEKLLIFSLLFLFSNLK